MAAYNPSLYSNHSSAYRNFPLEGYVLERDMVIYALSLKMRQDDLTIKDIPIELASSVLVNDIDDIEWLMSKEKKQGKYAFGISLQRNGKECYIEPSAFLKLSNHVNALFDNYDTLTKQLYDDAIHFKSEYPELVEIKYAEAFNEWVSTYYPATDNMYILALRLYIRIYLFQWVQEQDIGKMNLIKVFFYIWAFQIPAINQTVISIHHNLLEKGKESMIESHGYL